jgi:VWFA-related protein
MTRTLDRSAFLRLLIAGVVAAVTVCTRSAELQLGAAAESQQPVFRSGVDLVTIDVTVVAEGGRPVDNLTADKFRIRVDGTERRIVSAMFVPYKPASPRPAPAAAHFTSNEHVEPGRLLLIAVDQQHIRRVEGLAALRAATELIDQLDPADRVAAAPLTHIGPVQFTNEHASVKKYLQTLAGTGTSFRGGFTVGLVEALAIADGQRTWLDRVVLRECGQPLARFESLARIAEAEGFRDPCPVQVEQESRALAQEARGNARTSLNQLLGLIARLGEIEGPKTLVFVSEGLIAEPQLIDLTSLGAAAQAARVTIYVLQLEQPIFDASESVVSPTLSQDLQAKGDGLARLAGSARGALFRLVGADPYPFQRILRELSGYYLLAFEAAPADRDGRTRRIDVSTSVSGAVVRTRPTFRSSAEPSKDGEARLIRLLRSPRLATELPLRATAHMFRDSADGAIRVVVSAEADRGPSAHVTFGYVLVNADGVIAASGSNASDDGRFNQAVSVPPGRYKLKVAAIDPTGRQGSLERSVDAQLHSAGAAGLSDLALSDTEPGRALRPVVATTTADRLGAVLEIYGPVGWKPERLAVRVEVKAVNAPDAVITVPARISAVSGSSWRARAELALGNLSPGSYVATAHVALPDGAVRKIEREFWR